MNGKPISLDNFIVGGIQIRAGRYERDVTCTDPEHCLLAMRGGRNCATYFTDINNNVYCPSVRGNTGGNFNYGRNPGWKIPGRPILHVPSTSAPARTTPSANEIDGSWGVWSEWSPCSESCGGGTQSKFRLCNSPPPKYGGLNCTFQNIHSISKTENGTLKEIDAQTCNPQTCPTTTAAPAKNYLIESHGKKSCTIGTNVMSSLECKIACNLSTRIERSAYLPKEGQL